MLKQGLYQKQLQKLSPQQIQFIQLLQLNSIDFEKRLDEEMTENPALEIQSEDADDAFANNEQDVIDDTPAPILDKDADEYSMNDNSDGDNVETPEYEDYELDMSDYMDDVSEADEYSGYENPSDPNEEQKELPFAQSISLTETLEEQLAPLMMTDKEREIARHLIGMLEEDGYLRRPLKNIAYDMAFLSEMHVTEVELEQVLSIIQTLDPAGIGARSLEECLLIQLKRMSPQTDDLKMAKVLVEKYMDDLARKHYDKLTNSLKIDRVRLKTIVEIIRHLNPKPGENQISYKTQYIIPDFIVSVDDNDMFQISLTSRNTPMLKISQDYQDSIKGYQAGEKKDKSQKNKIQFIKQKLDNAKWFIEAVRQRQNTLLNTMNAIVSLQKDFFVDGDIEKLNPMILKDVADRINMDISTISRVANAKYVQTNHGIYSLKEFFSEGIQTDSGEEVSNREVKKILKDYIENESKDDPLTDEKLTDLLNEKGYNIARRTVAKYREQMNIPVARLRKEL